MGHDRATKPTVNDIARAAGVSLATVDRVLNERPGVRAKTIARVKGAINDLGFVRDSAAVNLARRRHYNLVFIIPKGQSEFLQALKAQITNNALSALNDRTTLSFIEAPAFDPQATAGILAEIDPGTVDGVAVFGLETPSMRDAIDRAKQNGLAVVTLVSDQPSSQRDAFVGIDNIAAGRTAGQLLGRFVRGDAPKVLVITGSTLSRSHIERRHGFDEVITQEFPNIRALPSIEGRDDGTLLENLLKTAFAAHPDITGIYSSSAGNKGLLRFLTTTDRSDTVTVVAHELTDLSRQALINRQFDAIISQDTGHLIRSAIRILRAKRDDLAINPAQEMIRIDVFVKENIPPKHHNTLSAIPSTGGTP